jgi:hypothetical protein
MKHLGFIMILMVFVIGFLLMYVQRRKPAVVSIPIEAGPGFDIPTWRILPYDPAKFGQPPVHNVYESPVRVRMPAGDPNRNLLF